MQGTLGYKQKPQCVHISNVHADLLPTDVYSGMYARETVNFFLYDASGNRGVGFGLGNVCKTRDGEPLSNSVVTAAEFAGVGGVQPQAGYTPGQINPITGQPM